MHTNTKAKLLSSKDAVEALRQQQATHVRRLQDEMKQKPSLAIVQLKDDPVISTYVKAKQRYGESIGAIVTIYKIDQTDALSHIHLLNSDDTVHGIIVQLPISHPDQTREILDSVTPQKDVDGLCIDSRFTPATPLAILALLAHHDIDISDKHIVVVGRGALVGTPLTKLLDQKQIAYDSLDVTTSDNESRIKKADVIISATGRPGLITSDLIKTSAVVVDAGTATEGGKTVGDVDERAFERADITITPRRGGVGPLTVCMLFKNLLEACAEQTTN